MPHDFKKFPELTDTQCELYYMESPHKQIFEDFKAKCVKVHDGDAITLEWTERNFTFPIRFINIAAPELSQDGGTEARDWLESRVLNEEVEIHINPLNRVDKWGRLLGNVICKGSDLGEDEIWAGHALPWSQVKDLSTIPTWDSLMIKAGKTWA